MKTIDPRMLIIQAVFSSFMIFITSGSRGIFLEIMLFVICLCFLRRPKDALKVFLYFAVIDIMFHLAAIYHVPLFLERICFLLHKLSPVMGIVCISLNAMTVSQLLSGLQRMKCPKSMTYAVAIALRFIPTIRQELSQIKDAIKTRGIRMNVFSVIQAPLSYLEYIMVPFIMRCVKIADELAASAACRAIENPKPRGEYRRLRIKYYDILYMGFVTVFNLGILIIDKRIGGVF